MRGLLKFFATAAMLCTFAACSIETDVTHTPADDIPEKSYTILYYNCCSGLDKAIEPVMEMSSFSYLCKTLLELVGAEIGACAKVLATVCGLLLVAAVCNALSSTMIGTELT